jgi:hypothetical protein
MFALPQSLTPNRRSGRTIRRNLLLFDRALSLLRGHRVAPYNHGAFWYDVHPVLREWRRSHGLPGDPVQTFEESGYLERITAERKERDTVSVTTYA